MNQETLDQRILAWSCFETLYLPTKTPGLRKLAAPDRQTWSAIATLYNRQRHQLATPGQDGSPELLERWLGQCVKATRAYLYPAVSSLNRPKSEDNTSEWQDQLVDEQSTDLLHEWITQEEIADRQTQQQQLQSQLMNAIATLEPNLQQLLTLYYQRQLTQQQIAQELGIPQYTVSRKLSKAREKLLLSLTQWMQASLHITPTSDVLKEISALLDEWLAAVLSAPVPIP
jgi:RNA polymerase sigma factor (sigma-70 family)